ncbi:MAG TPA: HAMP domain-containing histidine kinase [Phycisphaerales bacterium]|nr:HAMP domain-containing histidine kinase [Phycisphaerales bacterium]
MEQLPQDVRLVRRAYWLVRLRWIAALGVIIATFVADKILAIQLQEAAIYSIAALLVGYNSVVFLLLRYCDKGDLRMHRTMVTRIVNFQMSVDMVILTVLLHFAGGIENPFIIYFVFHMILASILLSARESYFQATLATILLTLLALLEYRGIVGHYYLNGFIEGSSFNNGYYVAGVLTALITTLYLVIYMTTSITSQLRKQEAAYWQANILLKEKDKIKDEYVARVTHDIKGHLAAIQGSLDVVNDGITGQLNDKQAEFVGRALERTKKLVTFVRTLLKLTKMRLTHELEKEYFPLGVTIENTMTAIKQRAESKSITVSYNHSSERYNIYGNSFSVEEMITNLMLNAIKYTPPDGKIELKITATKDFVEIAISDTGIGIPLEDISKVFDEFFRASNARKIERDGTGLGLSIAKQIVERHGGRIWAESQQGCGTTFRFTLPLTDKPLLASKTAV